MVKPHLNNLLFRFDLSLMVAIAKLGYGPWYVPVLEFGKIGEDGDFTKAFTFKLEEFDTIAGGDYTEWISRNKVPRRVKLNFIDLIGRLQAGEEVTSIPYADVSVRWKLEDIEAWEQRFPQKKLKGVHLWQMP
jgi:hypothetical protein